MAKKCLITVKDEVWCYITGLLPQDVEFLWNKFAIFVDGYFFMPAYKLGRWDGKIRFFEKTGKTYIRILDKIIPYIDNWNYEIELIDNRKIWKHPTLRCSEDMFSNVILGNKPFKIRKYQVDAVNTAIEAGSGYVIAGTGSGKTVMTAALSQIYSLSGYKTVTIVPSSDLVDQTAEWFELLQLDTGRYAGDYKDIYHMNVVATWQALQYNPHLLQDFQALIWDESHCIKASVAQKLINEYGKHIPFRFGVTGTFPKGQADQMSLFSSIGPILKEIPASWLIENGFLAQLNIHPVELDELYVTEEFPDYAAEKAFVSKSLARMETIANIIISQCAIHGNTLVLVNSVSFGEKLSSLIKDSIFLYGETPKDIRKEHYDMFEQRNDVIVIASSGIASTGISIDRVFCLVLVDSGKSFIRAIQSIGRGLRLAKDKQSVHIIDIFSKLKWSKKHFKEREKYYKDAQYPITKKQILKIKGE